MARFEIAGVHCGFSHDNTELVLWNSHKDKAVMVGLGTVETPSHKLGLYALTADKLERIPLNGNRAVRITVMQPTGLFVSPEFEESPETVLNRLEGMTHEEFHTA